MNKIWSTNFKNTFGWLFGFFGFVFSFLPLSDVTKSNVLARIVALLGVGVIAAIISFIWTRSIIYRKSVTVFSRGSTRIDFEYADINDILKKASKEKDEITVVVPINTRLDKAFDRAFIHDNTIHSICLDYINEMIKQKNGTESKLDNKTLEKVKVKKDGFIREGKLGDWFLLTSEELGVNVDVQFMFAEIYEIEEKNGKMINAGLKKEQYLSLLQSLISSIPDALDHEKKVYIPLIGAGDGRIGLPEDIMHIMNAILRFNKDALHQEIHVFIHEKHRESTPIYHLTEY